MNCYDHAPTRWRCPLSILSQWNKKNQDLWSCIFLSRFCHEVIHWIVLPKIKKITKTVQMNLDFKNCDLRLRFTQTRKDFTQLCQLKKL